MNEVLKYIDRRVAMLLKKKNSSHFQPGSQEFSQNMMIENKIIELKIIKMIIKSKFEVQL